MDAHYWGRRMFLVMHQTHNVRVIRRSAVAATEVSKISPRHGSITIPPFAAQFVTILPYAENGLLRNFESFSP
jgi:hypothetical protein